MKHIITVLFITTIVFASGCNYSAGFNKDLSTGLKFSYNGFRLSRVIMVDPDNKIMNKNEVTLNTKVAIVVSGISNYGLKDGKVFPGMMLSVSDKKGVVILGAADLFAGNEGYPAQSASELRGTITVAQPMVSGETYQVKIHVWDKVTPENTVDASTTIVVK